MAYTSKTWTDFDAEYPTRYKITHSDLTEEQVRIANDFGECTEGDVFDASTMNNLESRIASAFSDDADAIEDASGLNFAEEYDDTSTYTVNDYCVHEGLLYKCISTISTAEAWTPAHWSRVYVTDEIAGASSLQGLSDVNISSPTNGQALVYDATSSKWVNGAGGGGSSASGVYIGTCDTAGNQAQKQVTVSADQNFVLEKGATICVKFSYNNSAYNVTISVNGGTAYPIWYAGGVYANNVTNVAGRKDTNMFYVFDGSYWCWQGFGQYMSYTTMTDALAEAGTATTVCTIQPTVLKHAIEYHAPDAVRRELMQAEYDALSPAEKNNGTIYFIKDATMYFSSYTTSEKRIGTWIDGSSLYERTFDFNLDDMAGGSQTSSAINGRFDLPHISYDALWIEQAFILNDVPDSTLTIKSLPLPTIQNNNGYIRVQIQKTSSNDGYPFIYVDVQWSISQLFSKKDDIHYVFVIRYTK